MVVVRCMLCLLLSPKKFTHFKTSLYKNKMTKMPCKISEDYVTCFIGDLTALSSLLHIEVIQFFVIHMIQCPENWENIHLTLFSTYKKRREKRMWALKGRSPDKS